MYRMSKNTVRSRKELITKSGGLSIGMKQWMIAHIIPVWPNNMYCTEIADELGLERSEVSKIIVELPCSFLIAEGTRFGQNYYFYSEPADKKKTLEYVRAREEAKINAQIRDEKRKSG